MKFKMSLAALLAVTLLFATPPPASYCADTMPDTFVHIEDGYSRCPSGYPLFRRA